MSTSRLKQIYDLIPDTNVFADIGCDHGMLCKMVYDGGKAKRIIASDISSACLAKAKRLLGDNAEYFLGDGLAALGDIAPDVTVISGMGGNTILHILEGRALPMLIVSPHNDAYKVRDKLNSEGYMIVEDKVIYDDRYYDIIKLCRGEQELSELQKTFGAFFYNGDENFIKRLSICKNKLLSYKQTTENIKKLQLITEAEKWLR